MSHPTIKQRVDQIIRVGLAPQLKAAGFPKKGRTFRSYADDHCRIVSVNSAYQSVNLEHGSIGSFGIELGIYFPEVYKVNGVELDRQPGIHECYALSGLPGEGWGFFDDFQGNCPSVEEQTKAVEESWLKYGEAFFHTYRDPRAAMELARANEDWREALYFAIYLEDRKTAAQCLAMCRQMWGELMIEHLETIAARHGLDMSE